MWSQERQARIITQLAREGQVQTHVLAQMFDVSRETIRRDLLELERGGSLTRVHGGATLQGVEVAPEPTFSERLVDHAEAKRLIGETAIGLVPRGATLFIDAGTTTLAFARALMRRGDARVITNSIDIARLPPGPDCEILLLGGKPHLEVPLTYGEMTLSEIDRFLADIAIISPVAFHADRGAMNYDLHEAEIARHMMRQSRRCVMLCHAQKLGTESRVAICRAEQVDHLVTDDRGFNLPRGQVHRTP